MPLQLPDAQTFIKGSRAVPTASGTANVDVDVLTPGAAPNTADTRQRHHILAFDGDLETLGRGADAAQIDPTQTDTLMAYTKGLLSTIRALSAKLPTADQEALADTTIAQVVMALRSGGLTNAAHALGDIDGGAQSLVNKILASSSLIYSPANATHMQPYAADGDGINRSRVLAAGHVAYNGYTTGTYSPWRNNQVAILGIARPSGTLRTTSYSTPYLHNYNWRGMFVYVIVYAAGSGAISVQIYGSPAGQNATFTTHINFAPQIPANNQAYAYEVYTGTNTAATGFNTAGAVVLQRQSVAIPQDFLVQMSHTDPTTGWDYAVWVCPLL